MIFFDSEKKKERFIEIFTCYLDGNEEKVRKLLESLTNDGLQDFEYICRQLSRLSKEA